MHPVAELTHLYTYSGKRQYVAGRPMRADEVLALLDDFRRATRNALRAGFDGVQVHAANGYLIDEFLRDGTNFRNDAYGGTIENRVRLLREVTQAVIEIAGARRTGVRLTPNGTDQGVRDSDPETVFVAAARTLSVLGVAHLELREPPKDGTFGASDRPPFAPAIRRAFAGVTILNSDYGLDRATAAIDGDEADAVAFGRPFIANPDLPRRFSAGAPLAADKGTLWFTQGPEGYLDYLTLA
ncbi:oxidoreductase [Caballeronia sp. HLA56]